MLNSSIDLRIYITYEWLITMATFLAFLNSKVKVKELAQNRSDIYMHTGHQQMSVDPSEMCLSAINLTTHI